MDQATQNNINSWLFLRYGAGIDGRAKYRLIWANDETEYRYGIFLDKQVIRDKDGRKIVIESEVEDTRLCQKYNYCLDRWILEQLLIHNPSLTPDLVSATGVEYWPFYVFEHPVTREYIEPTEAGIEMLIYFNIHKTLKGHKPTEKAMYEANEAKFKAIRADIKERLDDAIPDTAHALVHGSAIIVPNKEIDKCSTESNSQEISSSAPASMGQK